MVSKKVKNKWLILTGSGKAIRGRFVGTKAQAEKYCKEHYMPNGYKIKPDTYIY